LPTRTSARTYHATRRLRQQDQPQSQIDGSGPRSDATRHIEEDTTPKGPAEAVEVDDREIEAAKLQHGIRMLMRNVPSSVAVITACSYDDELKRHVPMGVAVSSLSTVSLNPPTISFNIKQPSKTLDAIRGANGLFRVHFPAADRGGANMVDLFSRGNHADAYTMRNKGLHNLYVPGHSPRSDWFRQSVSQAPQIMNDSVRAAMECTLTQELSVADHVILVAKVDSLESKRQGDRTILYVDGSYMRPDGSKIAFHRNTTNMESNWSVWDYPLFPGEEERRDYMERIMTIVREQPHILQHGKQSIPQLEAMLPVSPSAWGINVEQLIAKCREEAGMPSVLPRESEDLPILSDFYGRLGPSDRAKIAKRVKTLVKDDDRYLSLNYRHFLQYIGVSSGSIDILPSDIAELLRAEGLLGAPWTRSEQSGPNGGPYNLQHLEQIEKRLIEHFRTMRYQEALSSQLDQVVESLGEPTFVATYFKRSRARILAAAFPVLFASTEFDIAGEVSLEEARVVLSRYVRFLGIGNSTKFRRNMHLDYHEVLRCIHVHPSITGFNVEYLVGKLKHLFLTTGSARDLKARVEEMLKPWFLSEVAWHDFEERVKTFVNKMPMQAMSWSIKDQLAAMGLDPEAVLDSPVSANKRSLSKGHIVNSLVAKELKGLYGNLTSKKNRAIARFLKERYNFEVNEPVDSLPLQASDRSSGDDMLEAMMARRNVDLRANRISTSSLDNDMLKAMMVERKVDVPGDEMNNPDLDREERELLAWAAANEAKGDH
jgi:flavin reductase (DIM6/NTAB) family NADH-FMN oxidoreductase RutF